MIKLKWGLCLILSAGLLACGGGGGGGNPATTGNSRTLPGGSGQGTTLAGSTPIQAQVLGQNFNQDLSGDISLTGLSFEGTGAAELELPNAYAGPVIDASGRIYVTQTEGTTTHLKAFNPDLATSRGQVETGLAIAPAIVDDGHIVVAVASGNVHRIEVLKTNADGTSFDLNSGPQSQRLAHPFSENEVIQQFSVLGNDIYVVTTLGGNTKLYKLDASTTPLRVDNTINGVSISAEAHTITRPLMLSGSSLIYIEDDNATVRKFFHVPINQTDPTAIRASLLCDNIAPDDTGDITYELADVKLSNTGNGVLWSGNARLHQFGGQQRIYQYSFSQSCDTNTEINILPEDSNKTTGENRLFLSTILEIENTVLQIKSKINHELFDADQTELAIIEVWENNIIINDKQLKQDTLTASSSLSEYDQDFAYKSVCQKKNTDKIICIIERENEALGLSEIDLDFTTTQNVSINTVARTNDATNRTSDPVSLIKNGEHLYLLGLRNTNLKPTLIKIK